MWLCMLMIRLSYFWVSRLARASEPRLKGVSYESTGRENLVISEFFQWNMIYRRKLRVYEVFWFNIFVYSEHTSNDVHFKGDSANLKKRLLYTYKRFFHVVPKKSGKSFSIYSTDQLLFTFWVALDSVASKDPPVLLALDNYLFKPRNVICIRSFL